MARLFDSNTHTTTQVELTPQQKQIMGLAIPKAVQYANSNQNIPAGRQLVAPFNAQQLEAQRSALGAARGGMTDLAGSGMDSQKFLMNKAILDPSTNRYLQSTIDAATRPISQALTEQELPQLRSGAAAAGQYGSSRQGISEGLASGRASQAIGDTAAKVANANYQAGLDAMTKALGLLPQTQQAQLAPSIAEGSVGDAQQQLKQSQMNTDLSRLMYNKGVPLAKAQNLTGMAAGTPGGGTSSSATGSPSLFDIISGTASLGAGIFGGQGTGWLGRLLLGG